MAQFLDRNRRYHGPWEPTRSVSYFTATQQRRIVRRARRGRRNILLFLFDRQDSRKIIGSVTFSNIVRGAFHSCYLGYRIDESYEGRGMMREALTVSIRYMFGIEGLHRLEANVMPGNVRSVRLLQRLGFRNEGRAQRYLNIQGRWEDHDHYVMLAEEWSEKPLTLTTRRSP